MKSSLAILVLLFSCVACFASPPKSKEEFLAAIRTACESNAPSQIRALAWENGVSDYDRQFVDRQLARMFKNEGAVIKNIRLDSGVFEKIDPAIMMGRRFEWTHPPDGTVVIELKLPEPNPSMGIHLPYAFIEGGFYIVAVKSTDLGWKGPEGREFNVNLQGKGLEKVKVHVKYNASGIDLERDDGGDRFQCQYIKEVTVTSGDDDVDVILRIADGTKNIYESKPLKGKGEIIYKKGDPSP